jgi:ElaB/YqjD/DUF883 family membrane-anchored ribosome-binding protein
MARRLKLRKNRSMNIATFLQNSANGYMAATMAKRVSTDVVRQLPYPAMGAAALLGVLAGVMIARRRQNAQR